MPKHLAAGTCIRVQSWQIPMSAPIEAEKALGTSWPMKDGMTASGKADILCIGPADWLVTAPTPDSATLLQTLRDCLRESSFRATDVSSALCCIQIEGE